MESGKHRGVVAIAALAAFTLGFELLKTGSLMETSAFYVGLPALLAVLVVAGTSPQSATGIVLKTLTVAILLSTFVLHACVVCMVIAAPLFFAVAIVVVALARLATRAGRVLFSIGLVPLVFLAAPGLDGSPHERVAVTRIVAARPAAVAAALAGPPRFDRRRPLLLHRVGYTATGSGLALGDVRRIRISVPGEGTGMLVLVVARRAPGLVVFAARADSSPVAEWLALRWTTVRWRSVSRGRTSVRWELSFERRVSPGWYFGPLLRYQARLAAGFLVDTIATPR